MLRQANVKLVILHALHVGEVEPTSAMHVKVGTVLMEQSAFFVLLLVMLAVDLVYMNVLNVNQPIYFTMACALIPLDAISLSLKIIVRQPAILRVQELNMLIMISAVLPIVILF